MKQLPQTIVDSVTPTQISDLKLVIDIYSARGQRESYSVAFGNQSPLIISAQSNQEYRLSFNKSDLAPEEIKTTRSKEDLLLYVGNKDSLVASILIKDYFDYPEQTLFGLGKDSQYHEYPLNENLNSPESILLYRLNESDSFQPSWLNQYTDNQDFFSQNKVGLIAGGLLGIGGLIALGNLGGSDDNGSSNKTGTLSIVGEAKEGETLIANISDANGVPTENIRYQWQRDGESIANATKSTYEPQQDDVGKKLTVTASYVDTDENRESITSKETKEVENANDVAKVTIDGSFKQNQQIIATVTDEDGLPDDKNGITYTWFANNVEVSSDKSNTFTLSQNEVGKNITVQASFTDKFGNKESVRSEASENKVEDINDAGIIAVEGKLQANEVLEAKVSDADGINTFSLRYQWYADDTPILGANSSKYTLTSNEVGKSITVKASYTDRSNNTENITSIATQKVGSESNNETSAKPSVGLHEVLDLSATFSFETDSTSNAGKPTVLSSKPSTTVQTVVNAPSLEGQHDEAVILPLII